MTLNKILAVSALAAVAALPLEGGSARAVKFEEKVHRADAIVVADHVGAEVEKDATGRWLITKHRFRVERALKGSAAGELVVMTPGGSLNGVHQRTVGVPQFDAGDRNVLFLKQRSDAASILYLDQGTYEVSGSGPTAMVTPVQSDLVLVDTVTGKAVSRREGPQKISEFEKAVGEVLARGGGRDFHSAAALRADAERVRDWRDDLHDFISGNQAALAIALLGATLSVIAWINRR